MIMMTIPQNCPYCKIENVHEVQTIPFMSTDELVYCHSKKLACCGKSYVLRLKYNITSEALAIVETKEQAE